MLEVHLYIMILICWNYNNFFFSIKDIYLIYLINWFWFLLLWVSSYSCTINFNFKFELYNTVDEQESISYVRNKRIGTQYNLLHYNPLVNFKYTDHVGRI